MEGWVGLSSGGAKKRGDGLGGREGGLLEIHCPLGALRRLPPHPPPPPIMLDSFIWLPLYFLKGGGEWNWVFPAVWGRIRTSFNLAKVLRQSTSPLFSSLVWRRGL